MLFSLNKSHTTVLLLFLVRNIYSKLFIELRSIVYSTTVLVNNSTRTEHRCRRFTNIYNYRTLCLNTLPKMETHNQQRTWATLNPNTISTIFMIFTSFSCTFWTKHYFFLFAMEITLVDGWCYCYFEALFTSAILAFEIRNVKCEFQWIVLPSFWA